MRCWRSVGLAVGLLLAFAKAQAAPVLLISVDGLRPADVLDADSRGIKVPTLGKLVAEGLYATGVRNALPTVTYPNHTTLITGVWPSRHGIANNQTFDPLQQNLAGWYWYGRDIKVRTLWDAVHDAGGTVASLSWPVSVGADSIDYDVPEYWRANLPEDLKLVRALSTKGLIDALEKSTGLSLADADGDTVKADDGRAQFTAAIIEVKHPTFITLHLRALDEIEHVYGPGSPQANATLEQLDASVGRLIAAARKAEPDLVVAIVSDHGFAPVAHDVNIIGPFVEAGLITLDPTTHKPTVWQAGLWGGASVAVVLAHPNDVATKAKVAALLAKLTGDPELGIDHVADASEIARIGGTKLASFWIDFKPGYEMGQNPSAPPLSPSSMRGTHGYFPSHPEMRATFILAGPSIPAKGSLGEVDMRDIAPTLAKVLQVNLPDADGHPVF
ncbi:MAG: ectonucleotide pyrophosphatase/phosphodiesterase [Rhizomicrobium sp.]